MVYALLFYTGPMMQPRYTMFSTTAKDGSLLLQTAFTGKRQPFQCQPKAYIPLWLDLKYTRVQAYSRIVTEKQIGWLWLRSAMESALAAC